MTLVPGVPTTEHWRVGRPHRVKHTGEVGECVSVTPWGGHRLRWVRLRFEPGLPLAGASHVAESEKSYAPSEVEALGLP